MHKAVFIIVFVLLARPVLPVAAYIINYHYIATELCENKAKPQMHCNGKCHLKKELAKAAENEKPLSGKKSARQESEIIYYLIQDSFEIPVNILFVYPENKTAYTNMYKHIAAFSFFHPPAVV